jgi:restriction endonuclease S subunit
MQSKFKVGDRVRYLPCKESGEWQNVTITKIDGNGYFGDDDNPNWKDGYFYDSHLELIEETSESKAISLLRKIVDYGGYGAIGVEAKAILGEIEPVDPLAAKAEQYYSEWLKDPSDMPFAQDAMLYAMRRMRDEGE